MENSASSLRGGKDLGVTLGLAGEGSDLDSDDYVSHVLPQGTAASTKNKLPGLITSMETIGAKALEDFADNIKVCSPFPSQARLAQELGAPQRAGLQESQLCS